MRGVKRKRVSGEEGAQISDLRADEEGMSADSPEPKEPSPKIPQNSRSLFVRSLAPSTTSEDLAEFFSQSYPIKHATVVIEKATGKSKGFGFVTFTDDQDSVTAQDTLQGTHLHGRAIRLDFAEPRHRRNDGEASAALHDQVKKPRAHQTPLLPKIIVRNLPWTIKHESQLADLFREFGKIKHVNFPKKKAGLSPGFGFVVFLKQDSAQKAIQAINGKELHGRSLAVDWAVDKQVWEDLQREDAAPSSTDRQEMPLNATTNEHEQPPESSFNSAGENLVSSNPVPGILSPAQASHEPAGDHDIQAERLTSTLFVRNVPFTATDQTLHDHFAVFGRLQSARIVKDTLSGQSKGTAFIRFTDATAFETCLREAAKIETLGHERGSSKSSVLEDNLRDTTGHFTLDGRILRIFRAVDKVEALRLSVENGTNRQESSVDKRNLYLLDEGRIVAQNSVQAKFSPVEISLREQSLKHRRMLLNKDPSLLLSLTRLSIRNLPKTFTEKALKALAREAILGFAKDVKGGLRKPLSKEENARGGHERRLAERARKAKGKGIVRQAKIIFENRDGSKISENSGVGRSRGYGFIEYTSHRWALMGLRWLNGHLLRESDLRNGSDAVVSTSKGSGVKRRLMVEFAIENAQVMARRQHRDTVQSRHLKNSERSDHAKDVQSSGPELANGVQNARSHLSTEDTRKQSIIGRKRMARKAKRRA